MPDPTPPAGALTAPPAAPKTPMALIAQAIESGVSVQELQGLFDLQERYERREAAQAFATAITAFQAEMPQVEKWKEGSKGAYKYAPYESIMKVAGPLLVKHGIVVTFTTKQEPTGLTVTCRIRVGTHAEETELYMPTPAANPMINAAQNQGITLSYAKRNAIKAALNIVETGEDLDGDPAGDLVNGSQIRELNDAIKRCEDAGAPVHFGKFLEWLQVKTLDQLPQRELGKALAELRNKLAAAKKGGAK